MEKENNFEEVFKVFESISNAEVIYYAGFLLKHLF